MSRGSSSHNYDYISACAPVPTLPSRFSLEIRQHPVQTRVSTSNERDRRPIDPPPIVQIRLENGSQQEMQDFLQNPYFFMCINLAHPSTDNDAFLSNRSTLSGQTVSSMYKLKDIDNHDGGFFVFGDLSVKVEGRYRLKFTLFEITMTGAVNLRYCFSDCFTVYPSKTFPGMLESTFLSRSFSDQGVRIRIRKEHRVQMSGSRKRKLSSQSTSTNQSAHTQHHGRQGSISRGSMQGDHSPYQYALSPTHAYMSYHQMRQHHAPPPPPSKSLQPPPPPQKYASNWYWSPTPDGIIDHDFRRRGSVNSVMTTDSSSASRHSPGQYHYRSTASVPFSPPPQPYDPTSRNHYHMHYTNPNKVMPSPPSFATQKSDARRRKSLEQPSRAASMSPLPSSTQRRSSFHYYDDNNVIRLPPLRNVLAQTGNELGEVDAAVTMMQLASHRHLTNATPKFQPAERSLEPRRASSPSLLKDSIW